MKPVTAGHWLEDGCMCVCTGPLGTNGQHVHGRQQQSTQESCGQQEDAKPVRSV